MKIFEKISKLKGYILIIVIGVILLLLSLFTKLIINNEGLLSTPRETIIIPLFYISIALIAIGIVQSFIVEFYKKKNNPKGNKKKLSYTATFDALRTTQKAVFKEIYKYHIDEIACDDLFKIFNNRHGDILKSESELLFRLLELENKGLVITRGIGEKTTVVKIPPDVEFNLEINKKLKS